MTAVGDDKGLVYHLHAGTDSSVDPSAAEFRRPPPPPLRQPKLIQAAAAAAAAAAIFAAPRGASYVHC